MSQAFKDLQDCNNYSFPPFLAVINSAHIRGQWESSLKKMSPMCWQPLTCCTSISECHSPAVLKPWEVHSKVKVPPRYLLQKWGSWNARGKKKTPPQIIFEFTIVSVPGRSFHPNQALQAPACGCGYWCLSTATKFLQTAEDPGQVKGRQGSVHSGTFESWLWSSPWDYCNKYNREIQRGHLRCGWSRLRCKQLSASLSSCLHRSQHSVSVRRLEKQWERQ